MYVCKECGQSLTRVYSQTNTRTIGFICNNGHYSPTRYGKRLLRADLPKKELVFDDMKILQEVGV